GVALAEGARLHRAGVRAVIGLGETEAADPLASGQAWQPRVLLRVAAVGVNRVHDEAALHRRARPQPRVAALELLHDEAVRHVAEPGAAVAVERGTEDAELAELRDQCDGKGTGAMMLGHHRPELG